MPIEVTKEYDLSEIKTDYFFSVYVCTQCWNKCKVELKDDSGTYFVCNKSFESSGAFKVIEQMSSICKGSNLRLVVTCGSESGKINQSVNSYNITNSKAVTVGHGYNLCIEEGLDEDYNDVYVNIVGWKGQG